MRERPILFSGPMVRAILEGLKTQTRRLVKPQPEWVVDGIPLAPKTIEVVRGNSIVAIDRPDGSTDLRLCTRIPCPYGASGDRLWVRETWRESHGGSGQIHYAASVSEYERNEKGPWKPSIYMPRAASRLLLEVKAVRVERLQEITEADAKSEGLQVQPIMRADEPVGTYREQFGFLWDSINAKRGHTWESNLWVWVVEFERVAA